MTIRCSFIAMRRAAAADDARLWGDMTMPYDPDRHHRRSIRLRGYDYAQPGAYFVTICAHERRCLLAALDGGALRLNDAGLMIERWWGELNRKFPGVQTDAFVVMPDHIHGIIIITAANRTIADRVDPNVGINAGGYADPPRHDDGDDFNAGDPIANDANDANDTPNRASLFAIIQWFKMMTTKK